MNAVLEAVRAKRTTKQEELDALLAAAVERDEKLPKEERAGLTDDESAKFEAIADVIRKLDKQDKQLSKEDARRAKAEAAAGEQERSNKGGAVVLHEPMTYEEHDHRTSFLKDIAAIAANGIGAGYGREAQAGRERLAQHAKEMDVETQKLATESRGQFNRFVDMYEGSYEARVNPNTTAGTGGEFVPPLWLVSQYAPFQRAGRVIANRVQNQPLPPGIDIINLPKITTGSLTAIQTANAAPVVSQDIVTKSVSAAVNTIAGQEDISMQLLEQSPLAMDGVIFDDLSRDYDMQLDRQVISGSGVNGQHRGALGQTTASANSTTAFNTDASKANAVTCASVLFWDGTTATSFTQYRSIVNGVTNIETLRFAAPTAIWAHPRRVNSWSLASDSTIGRPLYVPKSYSPWNALGSQEANPVVEGISGELYGLPVVKDANVPITCATGALTGGTGDVIGIVKEDDMILWEGTMRMRALPEILSGTLQIRFQVYAYSAFLPDRFAASTTVITGTTGLAAPSW